MSALRIVRRALVGILCSVPWLLAAADTTCRVAYDLGSSGIRAGASNGQGIVRTELDALNLLSEQRRTEEAIAATVAALGELQTKGGFEPACRHIGGGFSAWRLSLERNAQALAGTLARIHAASGVPIIVVPQRQEGAYAYLGARQILGSRLATTHVLDIGGGSLQVSGADTSFGDALGQKLWHAALCRVLGRPAASSCALQPVTGDELATARSLLAVRLKDIAISLPGAITMTSVSRPVSRGIRPALLKLEVSGVDTGGFRLSSLSQAIEMLHGLRTDEVAALSGIAAPHVNFLLSDLLLVEGLMLATGGDVLRVAEIDLTNVPGLLDDPRIYTWSEKYACYLDRLMSTGIQAYASDPAGCN
jgi:hypothetical protein